ncbi:Uma2 family endonuclease [Yinghuangia aomiensis]
MLEAVNVVVPDGLLIPDLVPARCVADADAAADATLRADDVALVVEIASLSTRASDRKMKPALYAAARHPALLAPRARTRPAAVPRHLDRGIYTDRLVQVGQTTATTEPFLFDIDPARLVRRGEVGVGSRAGAATH